MVAGTSCAVLAHLALFGWLLRKGIEFELPAPATAMEVVWITRVPREPDASANLPSPTMHPPRSARRAPAHRLSRSNNTEPRPDSAVPVFTDSDDVWMEPQRPSGPRFDSRPEIVARSRTDLMEIPAKMRLPMRDSSLLGQFSQMTQSGICNELRAALRSANGGDAEVIVRTMHDRGCTP